MKSERKRRGKNFCCALNFFGSFNTSTISRFGERFRNGQYSLVSFLFAILLTMTPCRAICKSGDTCPVPYGVGRHCKVAQKCCYFRKTVWPVFTWSGTVTL